MARFQGISMISISSDSEYDNDGHFASPMMTTYHPTQIISKQEIQEDEDFPYSEPSVIETGSYTSFRENTIFTMRMSEIQRFNSYSFHN